MDEGNNLDDSDCYNAAEERFNVGLMWFGKMKTTHFGKGWSDLPIDILDANQCELMAQKPIANDILAVKKDEAAVESADAIKKKAGDEGEAGTDKDKEEENKKGANADDDAEESNTETVVKEPDQKKARTAPVTISGDQEWKMRADVHSRMVKKMVDAMEMSPVCDSGLLKSFSYLPYTVNSLKQATSAEEIEQCVSKVVEGVDSANQLLASVIRANRDLTRENKKKTAMDQKRTVDEKKKEAEKRRAEDESTEKQALKKLNMTKSSVHFTYDWKGAGHPPIREFDSMEALSEALKTSESEILSAPFIVTADKKFTEIANSSGDDDSKTFPPSMAKFYEKFPQSETVRQTDRVQAPCGPKHGVKELLPAFEGILPLDRRVTGKLPSLESLQNHYNFYGWATTMVRHEWEHKYLASVRFQTRGSCKVLASSCDTEA